jgi:hypothetical protein
VSLIQCPACERFIRAEETICPFCNAMVEVPETTGVRPVRKSRAGVTFDGEGSGQEPAPITIYGPPPIRGDE